MIEQHPRAPQLLVKRCACRSVQVKLLSNLDFLKLSCPMEEKICHFAWLHISPWCETLKENFTDNYCMEKFFNLD